MGRTSGAIAGTQTTNVVDDGNEATPQRMETDCQGQPPRRVGLEAWLAETRTTQATAEYYAKWGTVAYAATAKRDATDATRPATHADGWLTTWPTAWPTDATAEWFAAWYTSEPGDDDDSASGRRDSP